MAQFSKKKRELSKKARMARNGCSEAQKKKGQTYIQWWQKASIIVTFEPVSDAHAHGGILTVMQTTVSDKLIMHTCA